ncbi:MAG: hypothetical protein LBU60_02665 [Clostridiales bacterium]|nr:hypothetical protein [Clostridiales bacterium]
MFRSFDSDIAKKTKNYAELIKQKFVETKDRLWSLAKFALKDYAHFDDSNRSFSLHHSVFRSGNMDYSTYYIDFDKDTPQREKFTPNNRRFYERSAW